MTLPSAPAAESTDVLVIGAGMAGLIAAGELQRAGRRVLVLDKGRGVGGRMASRRIGGATFDHGAQFITAGDAQFAALLAEAQRNGVVEEWGRAPASDDAPPVLRWRGKPTMSALARHLARGIEVRLETPLVTVQRADEGWRAVTTDGRSFTARAAVLTPPVPQSVGLLDAGGVAIAPEVRQRLDAIEYERCLAVLAVLDGPTVVRPPGGLAPGSGPIAWIADNQRKGVSAEPALTIHATPEFSAEHWDRDRTEAGRLLIRAASPWLLGDVRSFQVHGWRYARPTSVTVERCVVVSESPRLVLAGDAFGGPTVEGAALSGWAAAAMLRV